MCKTSVLRTFSSCPTHHSSFTAHHTPLIIHHSSDTTHHSYTTYHTPLIIRHSSYTTHHTPLIIHHSSYATHHTPLIIHHSSHSSYTTYHAPLIIQLALVSRAVAPLSSSFKSSSSRWPRRSRVMLGSFSESSLHCGQSFHLFLEMQNSWRAQRFVNLEVEISWQAHHFLDSQEAYPLSLYVGSHLKAYNVSLPAWELLPIQFLTILASCDITPLPTQLHPFTAKYSQQPCRVLT